MILYEEVAAATSKFACIVIGLVVSSVESRDERIGGRGRGECGGTVREERERVAESG